MKSTIIIDVESELKRLYTKLLESLTKYLDLQSQLAQIEISSTVIIWEEEEDEEPN